MREEATDCEVIANNWKEKAIFISMPYQSIESIFISLIVDMERKHCSMMIRTSVAEDELKGKFRQPLEVWDYLYMQEKSYYMVNPTLTFLW